MGVILAILIAAASTCPHVRANGDPAVASLIEEAARASATFRQLVAAIDGTNGLVYVEPGECRHGVHACLTLSVKVAGPHRILRILLDLHREVSQLIGALGHELQHALEVLSDVRLTTTEAAYLFYARIAPTANGRFETDDAIRAGLQVEREVEASRTRRKQP
jgi:hypothetical protein